MSHVTFISRNASRWAFFITFALAVALALIVAFDGSAAAQEGTAPAPAQMPAAPVGAPICGPTENVGGAIATNTTWAAGKVYVLTGDITVNQLTTLTIQPGAVIKINWDRGFTINGKLVANGTAEHPIYFTSIKDDSICGDTNGDTTASVPNTGDWRWIHFSEVGDADSQIRNAVVRFGGRDDEGYGRSEWRSPIRFYRTVPELESITFEKNHRNGAAIMGGDWLTKDLKESNVVHILEAGLRILQANTLTIPAGLIIKPEWDQGIIVDGKLIARGAVDAPIIFTSTADDTVCGTGVAGEPICDTNNNTTASVPNTGDWRWIDFTEVSDPQSEMSRVVVRYGGRDDEGYGRSGWRATIRLYRAVPILENISFEKNYRNAVAIAGGDWLTAGLRSTTVVHYIEGYVRIPQANTLTIPPGAKVKIAYDIGMVVDGRFVAQGTAAAPIIFTSAKDDTVCGVGAAGEPICDTNNDGVASVPATGDWRWIDFTPVSDPQSIIEHAAFHYGGRDDEGYGRSTWRAALRINTASPTISNTAFVDNWTGIDIWGDAHPTLICLDFEANESPYAIWNEAAVVSARNSWWGSVSGPTHATNPHGKGNKVTDGVEFSPWRTAPCILPPRAPEAAFEAVPTSGEAPLAVSFFNTSAGAVTSSQWAFGDGGVSAQMNPTHVYTRPGVYSVTLTVNGPAGSDTVTTTAYVQVAPTVYRMFMPMTLRPRR